MKWVAMGNSKFPAAGGIHTQVVVAMIQASDELLDQGTSES